MNVAFVSNVVYPFVMGGAEKRIYEIGRRLVERGHEVTVYSRHFWDGPKEIEQDGIWLRAIAPAVDLYTGNRRSISEAIGFATRSARPLLSHVDEHDVLVASVFPYFPVIPASVAAQRAGIPLVTTWHECWLEYWLEYLGVLGYPGMAVERIVARLPQYPVAVSTVTADRLATIGPGRRDIHVVPNGIDLAKIRAIESADDGYDVLFVGRLIPEKNVDVLIRAFAGVGSETTLGIIGDGPERMRLESLVDKVGIAPQVDILGRVEAHEEVLAHMHAAGVFAAPSIREGFGITYLEALAAGCTVVAADHPRSAADEVVDGAGFLVEPTVEGVRMGLERALNGEPPEFDPVERAKSFDWEVVVDQVESVHRRAIEFYRT